MGSCRFLDAKHGKCTFLDHEENEESRKAPFSETPVQVLAKEGSCFRISQTEMPWLGLLISSSFTCAAEGSAKEQNRRFRCLQDQSAMDFTYFIQRSKCIILE